MGLVVRLKGHRDLKVGEEERVEERERERENSASQRIRLARSSIDKVDLMHPHSNLPHRVSVILNSH